MKLQNFNKSNPDWGLSPVQTNATLLVNNSQHCWMQRVASFCTHPSPLLHVVVCCWELLLNVWNQSNFWANNSQHSLCSVIAEAQRYNVGSVCRALLTLLGPSMRITQGLQSVTGWNLHKMHCRSQNCWELFHPFAHHCQRGRNNSQHCWLTLEKNSLIIYKNAWRQVSFFKFSE